MVPLVPKKKAKASRVKYCPVCASESGQKYCYTKLDFSILKCTGCGLGSTHLEPTFNPLQIYSEAYFHGKLKDGYVDYTGSESVLRNEFRRVLRSLNSVGRTSGKLLEIGCAYGFFLLEAQGRFEVSGLEVSDEAVAFCKSRRLNVKQGTVTEQFLAEKGPFDVVVMLDVIEHVADPEELLTLVHRYLRPRGHLLITTGDWASLLSRLMRSSWRLMTPPQHLFFFSKLTLQSLLERLGFRVLEFSHPGKLVPLSLVLFQLMRILGLKQKTLSRFSQIAIPINLFDAMRFIAVRE
jgi:SAM-dependent methyltransferase